MIHFYNLGLKFKNRLSGWWLLLHGSLVSAKSGLEKQSEDIGRSKPFPEYWLCSETQWHELCQELHHRFIIIYLDRKRCVFCESWTNSPLPYSYYDHIRKCWLTVTVYSGGAIPGRRAGSGVGKYSAESPKQDSKRFKSQVKRNSLPIWVWLIYELQPSGTRFNVSCCT